MNSTGRDFFTEDRLFTPGPTPVPLGIKSSVLTADIYHRSSAFREILTQTRGGLAKIFKSSIEPVILTCSGTGALEASVVHLTSPKDLVLVLKIGNFGKRIVSMAKVFECQVDVLESPAGEAVDLAKLEQQLNLKKYRSVFFQANETSTGVANPTQEIVALVKKKSPETFIIVDGISALCAHDLDMAWGIDCLISGSQKGFGVPPGLAFVALSERGWNFKSLRSRFYFDLIKEKSGQDEGKTAWTPASSIVVQLFAACKEINGMGIDKMVAHHALLARAVRAALCEMGCELFAKNHYSQALTSFLPPQKIDPEKFKKHLQNRYGVLLAGGQDELQGKILRFAHLGFISKLHIVQGLTAMELALHEMGHEKTVGNGTKKAIQIFAGG